MANSLLNFECLYSAYILPIHCVTIDLVSGTPIYGQAILTPGDKPLSLAMLGRSSPVSPEGGEAKTIIKLIINL